jgi:hypothetical protein
MAFLKRLFYPLIGRDKSKQATSSSTTSASLQTTSQSDDTYDSIDAPEVCRAPNPPPQRRGQQQQQQQQSSSQLLQIRSRPNKSQMRPMLFHCQLAHGGPIGVITGFNNTRDLYRKIAECYDIEPSEVRTGQRA